MESFGDLVRIVPAFRERKRNDHDPPERFVPLQKPLNVLDGVVKPVVGVSLDAQLFVEPAEPTLGGDGPGDRPEGVEEGEGEGEPLPVREEPAHDFSISRINAALVMLTIPMPTATIP